MSLKNYVSSSANVFKRPENPIYEKLNRFVDGTELKCLGLFIHTGNYGEECSMLTDENIIVNLPKHKLKNVKEILSNPEAVELIKLGNEKVVVRQYIDSQKRKQLTVDFL